MQPYQQGGILLFDRPHQRVHLILERTDFLLRDVTSQTIRFLL